MKKNSVSVSHLKKIINFPLIISIFLALVIVLLLINSSNYFSLTNLSPAEVEANDLYVKIDSSFFEDKGKIEYQKIMVPPLNRLLLDISSLNNRQIDYVMNSLGMMNHDKIINSNTGTIIVESVNYPIEVILQNNKINILKKTGNYIIEFNELPLLLKEQDNINNIKDLKNRLNTEGYENPEIKSAIESEIRKSSDSIEEHEYLLRKEHNAAIKKIKNKIKESSSITGNQIAYADEPKIDKEFFNTFNGIAVSGLPSETIQRIKELGYKIYPDNIKKSLLSESVPIIGANEVWDTGYDGTDIVIAIIDTGVDYTRPELGSCSESDFLLGLCKKVIGGYDFVNLDDDPMDDQGHGTHVAATAAGIGNPDFEYSYKLKEHLFDFEIDNNIVKLNAEFEQGPKSGIYFLSGDGTKFTLSGIEHNSIISSQNNSINVDISNFKIKIIFPSYISGESSKTNMLIASNVTTTEEGNFVSLRNPVTSKRFECQDSTECIISDNIILTIKDSFVIRLNKGFTFEAPEQIKFDRIIDKKGNYLILPKTEDFPTEEYEIRIYNPEGRILDSHNFKWQNNEIIHTINDDFSFGSGSGGSSGGNNIISEIQGQNIEELQGIPILNGVAPGAKIFAIKVLDEYGSGTESSVIAGIELAVDPNNDGDFSDHVDIISMSLGGPGNPDDPISKSIDSAVEAGVLAVVAAGNSGPFEQSIGSPGTARDALTIGATDKSDEIAYFSSRGPVIWEGGSLNKPDVVAPGVEICATRWNNSFPGSECLDDHHISISGTSMATPHVSGVAALIMQKYPELSPKDVKGLIKTSAKNLGLPSNVQGTGRVDAISALNSMIILKGELDFGRINLSESLVTKRFKIKNIADEQVSLSINPSPAVNEDSILFNAISVDKNEVTLNPGEETSIKATLTIPVEYEGLFIGSITISHSDTTYFIPYSFSKYSEVILEIEGDHYPTFILHTDDLKKSYGALQDLDFVGNKTTFFVKSGHYTIYAKSDFVVPHSRIIFPETTEYILSDKLEVPVGSQLTKTLSLNNARKFIVKARSISNEELYLREWTTGFITYKDNLFSCKDYDNEFLCENNVEGKLCTWKGFSCIPRSARLIQADPSFGDKEIYLSNKPDNNLDTDILIKYLGTPEDYEKQSGIEFKTRTIGLPNE